MKTGFDVLATLRKSLDLAASLKNKVFNILKRTESNDMKDNDEILDNAARELNVIFESSKAGERGTISGTQMKQTIRLIREQTAAAEKKFENR